MNSDTIDINNMIGRCRQDDYLWPNLSVREHLDIFAGLKGVAPHQHDETVQKWLEHVDLCAHQHFMCSEISGGMRRRLSVALATIGDPSFLILDEPTTGMVRYMK